ncbi:MAG: hypothetical protein A2176_04805 [Spirochaetes bacterium RBG_13_51_14]|nr:MAG: hypothetical protein A2176_04805 [Spirochaetes bacterium RBG_13_51_14]
MMPHASLNINHEQVEHRMLLRTLFSIIIALICALAHANQWHDEADRCWNKAQKLKSERNYKEAIEYLKRAVTAEKKNEKPRVDELIAQLNELGRLYDITGAYDKSLHYYALMRETSNKYRQPEQVALALNSIGQVYFNLNRFDDSLASYQQALDISKKRGHRDITALVLNNMGTTYRVMKDFTRALEQYNDALSTAKESGISSNVAVITSNIGTMYFFMGDYDRALKHYAEALDIDQRQGGEKNISIDLSNIGGVYFSKGRLGDALGHFEKALEIDTRMKNENNMASRLNRIGDIYYRLGDNTIAIENYNRSLEINLRLNNSVNAALVQSSIGQVYESMGRFEEALDYYIKALSLNREMELKENIALRLSDIGMLYETRERHGEAMDCLGKALFQNMMAEKRNKIADSLSNIGRIMISLKRYDRAVEYFNQSLEIYRELGDALSTGDDLKNIGIVYYYRGEYAAAVEYLQKAIGTLAPVKRRIDMNLMNVTGDAYRWLAAAFVKANRPDRAYETCEMFSAYKINSFISDDRPGNRKQSADFGILRNRIGANSAIVLFSNIIWDNPLMIYIDSERAEGYEIDKAAMVNAVYNVMGKVIEQFMGRKKTDIIFAINQKSRRDYYYVEFEKIISYYRHILSKKYITKEEFDAISYLGTMLYRFLFKNIEQRIEGKDELIIQPEGVLTTIPFETLTMPDGRFLVEKYSIRYSYSQTAAAQMPNRGSPAGKKSVLAFTGITTPLLPQRKAVESALQFEIITEDVIGKIRDNKDIGEMYGYFGIDNLRSILPVVTKASEISMIRSDAETVSGDRASESELKKMSRMNILGDYRIIHFSSGGIVVPEVPQMSVIALSCRKNEGDGNEGLLNAKEIAGLAIRADLVHIADLHIPPVGYTRGEGLWYLCSSFIDAGARGVSVSLWPVDEATNTSFMKRVYQLALDEGISFDRAFTKTKRSFIKGEFDAGTAGSGVSEKGKHTNPYFWGSCVYYGNQ